MFVRFIRYGALVLYYHRVVSAKITLHRCLISVANGNTIATVRTPRHLIIDIAFFVSTHPTQIAQTIVRVFSRCPSLVGALNANAMINYDF
jgi:hypothetical protein